METLVAVLLVVVSLGFLAIAIDATRYPKVGKRCEAHNAQ